MLTRELVREAAPVGGCGDRIVLSSDSPYFVCISSGITSLSFPYCFASIDITASGS